MALQSPQKGSKQGSKGSQKHEGVCKIEPGVGSLGRIIGYVRMVANEEKRIVFSLG